MSDQITNLQNALQADPDNWEIRYSLIHSLHQEGRTNEAIDLIAGITELPTDDSSIIYAAQSYQILGAVEQAESVYRTALNLNPRNAQAVAGLQSLGIEYTATASAAPIPVAVIEDEPLEAKTVQLEDAAKALSEAFEGGEVSSAAHRLSAAPAPAPVITKDDTTVYDPEIAQLLDQIHEAEEVSKRRYQASIRRDKLNAVFVTILVHVGIVLLLGWVVQKVPKAVPPQMKASSSAETESDETIEKQTLQKNSLRAAPSAASTADILSIDAASAIALTSLDSFTGMEAPAETGMTFQPSMSMGMPSSSDSLMMFGEPLEGETLGVVLDVSGSMAEWLPLVIAEVDRNFKDAPIVYIRNAKIDTDKRPVEIRPIVEQEVKPHREDKTRSPFWFLWGDLPRKAPQRSVDRLIETFKTRTNQFLAVGESGHWHGGDRLGEAMKFLAQQGCDAVYVFSDFEDHIDPDVASEHGKYLSRSKVRTYIQPAVQESEFISVMKNKIAVRSKGRQLPSLASVIRPEEKPKLPNSRPVVKMVEGITYAAPRTQKIGSEFYQFKPNKSWTELHRIEEPEFDAVFYGPEARGAIFLKNREGQYIQQPIEFGYHSHKYLTEHPDPAFRWRRRKFLKNSEPPKFDGKEIVWKMILEDNLKFDVHLYLDRKGISATYVADLPKDETRDHAHIYFKIPQLARERNDLYFGQDLPESGLKLNDVRTYAKENQVVFNLPRAERDRFEKEWNKRGFKGGQNTRTFDSLVTRYPNGVRDITVSGKSFGERVFHARTTSSKVLLHCGSSRQDSEPWEGFHAGLSRSNEVRTKFTKTEAIAFMIE